MQRYQGFPVGCRRMDRRIVAQRGLDQRQRRTVGGSLTQIVRAPSSDIGAHHIVDERVSLCRVRGIGRNRKGIQPRGRAFGGNHEAESVMTADFAASAARLHENGWSCDHQADIARGQIRDLHVRIDFADVTANRHESARCRLDIRLVSGIRVLAVGDQCDAHEFVGRLNN